MKVKVKVIPQQAEVAQGVPGSLRPRMFLTFRHYKVGRSSAIRTGRLYPRRNPCYSLSEFMAHGSVGESQGINPQ